MTHKTLLCMGCAFIILFLVSCASKKNVSEEPVVLTPTVEKSAIALQTPKPVKKQFFDSITPSVLSKVENGTLKDLQSALQELKRLDESYSDSEAVLINVIHGILTIMYSQTSFSVPIPENVIENSYTAAVDSAKKGVYDFSSGKSDFLSLVLPSLVLITAPALDNYYNEAKKSLETAMSVNEDSFLAQFLYGLLLSRLNNQNEALVFLGKAYKKDFSYVSLCRLYMNTLYSAGLFSDAFSTAVALLQLSPNDLDALKVCANITYKEKDYEAAEQWVTQVLQKEPDNIEFFLFRARILMDKGDYIRVSSLLDLYARTNNTGKEYLLLRTRLQTEWNKNTAAASNTIQEALNLYPDDIEVLLLAASLSAQSGQKIGSYSLDSLLDLVLQQEPKNTQALQLTVNEYIRIQNWQKAYIFSTQIFSDGNPVEINFLSHIDICIALEKIAEARSVFETLSLQSSNQGSLSLALVKILIAEGNVEEARRQIDMILTESADSRVKSVLFYERSRIDVDNETKLADLRSSLTANPRNNDALFSLYTFYFKKNDYRKAQYYLKQVVALSPNDQRLLKLNEEIENLLAN